MHLKSLDIVGFKSFADRTRLSFEKGMTAVVGPNGCGKSNISDAIRWVLGEQSAKALRGGNMADVIFNGAEAAKPLNMAEVNLTLTECEGVLDTEYNEVTVTRRVFRSGEGQYFINKRPCRLKDIQRLFMGTGIGTNAYSVLEQGKIDMILSSRPDDRRAVFEEAAGVTKFKADRKDALRKLSQTEANLLRLDDVVREVKRRIGSLQRQAGKAKRYKTIQDELKGTDIFLARKRVREIEEHTTALQEAVDALQKEYDNLHRDVEERESKVGEAREGLKSTEQAISEAMESTVRARTEWESTKQLITVNKDRIQELEDYTTRDTKDADEARSRLADHESGLVEHTKATEAAKVTFDEAHVILEEARGRLQAVETELNNVRQSVQARRAEANRTEQKTHQLQNQLAQMDARDRDTVLRRERLQGEQEDLQKAMTLRDQAVRDLDSQGNTLANNLQEQEASVDTLQQNRGAKDALAKQAREEVTELQRTTAGLQAKLDLLSSATVRDEGFPGGAKALLGEEPLPGLNPERILGSLAQSLEVDDGYHAAVEAILRPWVDAVVVARKEDLPDILQVLHQQQAGAARLIAADCSTASAISGPGEALLEHVRAPEALQAIISQLLAPVRLVKTLPQGTPDAGITWVTADGRVVRGDGTAEFPEGEKKSHSPLALEHERRQTVAAVEAKRSELETLQARLTELQADSESSTQKLTVARGARDELRQKLAAHRGEKQAADRELNQTKTRLEQVTRDVEKLNASNAEGDEKRKRLSEELDSGRNALDGLRETTAKDVESLKEKEDGRNTLVNEVTELRVKTAEARQQHESHLRQQQPMQERIREIKAVIEERARGANTYRERIGKLQAELKDGQARIAPLEEAMKKQQDVLNQARQSRQTRIDHVAELEKELRENRHRVEGLSHQRGKKDINLAEERVRLQNLVERLLRDYDLNREQLDEVPDPEWKDGVMPPLSELEKTVDESRRKLEAMGPVNLVAIEEYQEVEERYQFLMQQQEDLVASKEQLLEMIKKINETTTELFTKTFNDVNEHFQVLFKSLFGGGSARLELVDAEDVLESGIDIIARPPGKKLQRVSLLSGGERTMTAVALLFSLYTVKPSPFCVLDELDAALDDANIGRFVDMLSTFVVDSQFVVITHNRKTIEAASTLYGVTMQRKGISQIVSVKLTDYEATLQRPKAANGKEIGAKKSPAKEEASAAT